MVDNRINKRVHSWALRLALSGTKNAYFIVCKFARAIGAWDRDRESIANLRAVDLKLRDFYKNKWLNEINREDSVRGPGRNKLRTYRLLKQEFGAAEYVKHPFLTKQQRSALAKFRCGVAPLRLETGRYEGLTEEERLCPLCNIEIENELHVITKCDIYDDLRLVLYDEAIAVNENFANLCDMDKLVFLLTNDKTVKIVAKTCVSILNRRKVLLYN